MVLWDLGESYKLTKQKASMFIGYISRKGIYGKIIEKRNLSVKIKIVIGDRDYGYVIINYSPKRCCYWFDSDEVNSRYVTNCLENHWHDMEMERIKNDKKKLQMKNSKKYVIEI